ncbi:MAG TPA: hypothetical protein VM709_01900 [Candidatus Sulfotelmatobacter sp.]|nr:hypothetical protein [Candidatus Sulfotelmatobacter sp.]
MAPSAIAAHPLKGEVVGSTIVELSPPPSLDAKRTVRALEALREINPAFQFSEAVLLDENRFKSGSPALKLAASILLHVTVITVPMLYWPVFHRYHQRQAVRCGDAGGAATSPTAATSSNCPRHQGCEVSRQIPHRRQALRTDSHSQANR